MDKTFSKVIKGYGDLHVLVFGVGVTVSQQHDFIMMCHVIIRNCDKARPFDGVDQTVVTVRQGTVVHPDMRSAEDGHAVAVRYSPPPEVPWGVTHHSIPSPLAVVYVNAVYDNVGHILYGDAWTTCYVDARSSTVDCFERVHDQFFLESDGHVALEDDPQRFVLDDGVA